MSLWSTSLTRTSKSDKGQNEKGEKQIPRFSFFERAVNNFRRLALLLFFYFKLAARYLFLPQTNSLYQRMKNRK